ncbi:MAG TPA: phage major capsid protein [Anaerolineae bacterium]|nr:phage major capsid protein [Anaerolineae bacterium]
MKNSILGSHDEPWEEESTKTTTAVLTPDPRSDNPDDEVPVSGDLIPHAERINKLASLLLDKVDEKTAPSITAIRNELKELRDMMAAEFKASEEAQRLDGAPVLGTEKGQWSLFRTCKALALKDWSEAPVELEVGRAMKKKALALGVDSSGGYIVPENYSAQIIELLDQENPLLALGARILPGIKGSPLILPKQATRAAATYIGENTTIPKTQPTLGQIEFNPRTLAASTEISNTLRENATPEVEAFITDDLRTQFDNALTNYGLLGNGSGFQPTGVINETGIAATTFTNPLTFNNLIDIVAALRTANALRGKLGWCMHPDVLTAIEKRLDATDQPTERRVLSAAPDTMVRGYPFRTTTALPATGNSCIFGDWSQLLIPTWKTLELRATDVGAGTFEKDTMLVRALLRHDMGVRHAESFSLGDTFLA